ncbi:hypothetical protein QUA54_02530 [Microcoleus sp. MOSTC5]
MAGIQELATAAASGWLRQRISICTRCSWIVLGRAIVLRTGDR